MPPLKVLIFGGSVEQAGYIQKLIPEGYEISVVPGARIMETSQEKYCPLVAIVIQEQSGQDWDKRLRTVMERCRGTPILTIAERPSKKDIINSFRKGTGDFLIYPPSEEEFRAIFLKLANPCPVPQEPPVSWLNKALGRVRNRLRSLGRKRLARTAVAPYPITILSLPIALSGHPSLSEEGDNNQNTNRLEAYLFGAFALFYGARLLKTMAGKKPNSILAFLLYHNHRPVHREILMEKFWGQSAPSSARNSLNVAIYNIRKHFHECLPGLEMLAYDSDTYFLNPELDIISDVESFLNYWKQGRALESREGLAQALGLYKQASSLYVGDFLTDFPYEKWCEAERDSLRETYLFILDRLNTYFFEMGAYNSAVHICSRMLEKDPCLEEVHRKLIIAFAQLGYRDKAIRQYYKCERILQEELAVEPSAPTKALFEQLSKGRLLLTV